MKHLGDICKINGAEAEPVSVIIGGSPCQDLSVAGKRAGLDGERSGLFMEQIRIIKEMRESDRRNERTGELCRPRYMVWENVPGAFSSNKGEDFRIVLEETAKIADPEISIPRPPQGKWTNAGAIMGRGYSIAWRVLDAQYFGVPQRRRRIALVADFGGQSAPEILFERKSLSGSIEQSGTQRERTAADAERSVDKTICCGINGDIAGTLDASYYKGTGNRNGQEREIIAYGISAYESNAMKSSNPHSGVYEADTSRTLDNNGGNPACNQGGIAVVSMATKQLSQNIGNYELKQEIEQEKIGTQVATGPGAIATQSVVRRLTPLECERLQGYPDGWTDIGDWTDTKGKKRKEADSPRYKACGNSIAIPCWRFILRGISQRVTEHTMASLFDGIGGFPLIWEEINGSKSCRWVSEIEEFPIAVTKIRFEQE